MTNEELEQQLQAQREMIDAQSEQIKQLQAERDEAVRLSKEINDRMEEILKAVNKTSVEKMADAVKKGMNLATTIITKEQAFISNAGTVARNAGDRVWKSFQNYGTKATTALNQMGKDIDSAITDFKKNVREVTDKALGGIRDAGNKVLAAFQPGIDKVDDAIFTFENNCQDVWEDFTDRLDFASADFQLKVAAISERTSSVLHAAKQAFRDEVELAKENAGIIKGNIKDATRVVTDPILDLINEGIETDKKNLQHIKDFVKDVKEDMSVQKDAKQRLKDEREAAKREYKEADKARKQAFKEEKKGYKEYRKAQKQAEKE
jgi:hypothetical protein